MNTRAGTPATTADLVDLAALETAYWQNLPHPDNPAEQVSFGTSGHRGSALNNSFNQAHIVAICLAIAQYRSAQGYQGPLFLGADTHPLSAPALATATAVFSACGVPLKVSAGAEYVPTPALSRAIIRHNQQHPKQADGVIITPSHNPPADGGIKYNPPHAGPADSATTQIIADSANAFLRTICANPRLLADLPALIRECGLPATPATTPQPYDFLHSYVAELAEIIDFTHLKRDQVEFAVHPLGGAATAYWQAIAEHYQLNLRILGNGIDKQWGFMRLDWDGKIRMDPSSPAVMQTVTAAAGDARLAVANDADADRHGIVCDGKLMNPNHFLAVALDYLLRTRTAWSDTPVVGKTAVSSDILDRVAAAAGATVQAVPVGFKWFVAGLVAETTVFAGEESAGATFLTRAGNLWTSDKDGIVMCLLAAEIFANTGKTPQQHYTELTKLHGQPWYARTDFAASAAQKAKLLAITPTSLCLDTFAGAEITLLTNEIAGQAFGGLYLKTASAWVAIRPSGTEAVLKIYAESFLGEEHLQTVQAAAKDLLATVLGADGEC